MCVLSIDSIHVCDRWFNNVFYHLKLTCMYISSCHSAFTSFLPRSPFLSPEPLLDEVLERAVPGSQPARGHAPPRVGVPESDHRLALPVSVLALALGTELKRKEYENISLVGSSLGFSRKLICECV